MWLNGVYTRGVKKTMLALALLWGVVAHSQPTLTGFTPGSGPVGTLVTLTGTNLSNPTNIFIGGVAAIPISNDGTTLVAMVMPGASTGGVSVTTAGGPANASGNFSVISCQPPNTQQGNKLQETGSVGLAQQGASVALSADGNTAIVGAYYADAGKGAAFVYIRSGNNWTLQTKLIGTTSSPNPYQGESVALSADGNTAIVGGTVDNGSVGAAWIFTRSGTNWSQQGDKLVGTGYMGASQQGRSVALSADGNTAIVGGNNDNGGEGAAWIFTRSGGTWNQLGGKLVGGGAVGKAEQGFSVSLSADGNTAVVGGNRDQGGNGAVWIYIRNASSFVQQGNKLVGTGDIGNAQQGCAVSINANGNTVLVGGMMDNNGGSKGAAWVFTRTGTTWLQQGQKLLVSGNVGTANLGSSVALNADGNIAIIGGFADNTSIGASWIFYRSGSTWTQLSKLVGTGNTGNSQQGYSSSISADGKTAIIGGYRDFNDIGASWIFKYEPQLPTIISFSPTAAGTGAVISITGTNLIGATAITLGGTSVASFTVVSSTNILAIVGAGSTGALSVTTPGGTTSLSGFAYLPPPVINSFEATTGPVGTLVTLTGSNLSNPTNIVIGSVAAIPISNDGTTLVAMVMPGASTGGVSVTTAGGTANASGNFSVISSQPPNAQQGNKLVGTGNSGNAKQGRSVALSADGNTAIIGGPNDDGFKGAAWIFTRSGGTWSQQGTKLVGSGAIGGSAQQGVSVALSADGNTAIIGGDNDDGGKGAAWIFTRTAGIWSQQGIKLVASDAMSDANMGNSVSLSADGNTAIVGGNNDNGGVGAAWIFARNGGNWTQQGTKLFGTGAEGNAFQGQSVAISADGNTILIGGNGDKVFLGATWVFVRSGGTWIQQGTKLFGNDVSGGNPQQGWSVGLSADGNTAIVGGLYDVNRGAAWIFKRTGSSWVQQGGKLIGTGDIDGANQGSSVALSADGNTAIIGGYQDNSGVGSIWVFSRNGELWTQQGTKLVGSAAVGNANQGQSVAISANGTTAISGGDGDNGTRGAAWFFTYVPPPTITQFSPTVAATGALIAITGTNLLETSSITLGGTSVASFTVVSSTSILAVVGNGSSGAMSLVTPGGATSLAGFSYIPPPTITQFSPTVAAAGALIAITGTHLLETSSITLGGTSVAAFSIVSSTSILAVVGNGSSGAMSLVTPGGTTSLAGFIFIPPPIISSISPTAVGAGGLITITGSNLNGTFAITLGGTPVQSFTEVSSGTIVAAVGTGSTGAISLTTPGGNTSAVGFVFVPPPFISSFSSTVGPIGTLVTINGSNLNHLMSVVIAGVGAIPISNDGNTLVAMVMPGATVGGVSVVTVGGAAAGTGNFSVTSSQPPNAQQGMKVAGSGLSVNAWQGWSVDLSADGNTAITGCPIDGSLMGAATIFIRNGNVWTQQAKLVGSNVQQFIAQQGTGVAISADGNTAVVGGNRDNNFRGAAWVFTRNSNGEWTQQGDKLVGSDALFRSNQGWSVDISADGNTILIGGLGDFGGIGAAWIFTRSGGIWTQQGNKLVGTGYDGLAYQGWRVSLSADGNTALIGGYRDANLIGATWVFTRNGNNWIQQGEKLIGTGAGDAAQQGWNLSISADGNTAVIGGNQDDFGKGAAWIFKRNNGAWFQQGNKLVGTDASSNSNQGRSVSISADGNIVIVGGSEDNNKTGAAWIFSRNGDTWTQQCGKLVGSGATNNANQGESVSLSADGNTAIIGGYTDNNDAGAAWAFTFVTPALLSSFSPTAAGSGSVITLTGSNLIGTSSVTIGGTPVQSFTVISDNLVSARVGSGTSGEISLVTVGCAAVLTGFSYIPAPIITSFSPTKAAQGAILNIEGSYFIGTSQITLGGTPVTNFTVISDNSIVASVGNGASGDVSLTTLGGTAALSGFIFIPPPIIASFSPTAAATGAEINILGTHLDGTFSITLGDTPVSSFTVVSSTSIVATVSTGSSGDVRLTTPGGTTSLNGFVFIPPPIISGFSPSSLGAGQAMTISGNFLTDTYAITLGDTPVNSFTVVSPTTIVAIVGNGSSGAVSLTTPGGSANRDGFNFIPAPNITLFYPTAAGIGTLITITGSNLNGTSLISLGGVSVNGFTVVSSNTIVAMVGNGSSGEMSLITPGGTATRNGFTFIPPPIITSFLPNTAASGAIITITGNNLNGTTSLSLGGTPVSAFTVVSSTSIIARVSANGSTGDVSLTTPGGTTALNGFVFIPPPIITSFLPNIAASGSIITITGNNLNGTTSLSLGGTPVSAFTVVSSTSIIASVSAGSTGAVSLTTPGGTTALNGFVFIPPPIITSFLPNIAASGAIITITGNNLNGTTSLSLGGTPVSAFTVVSSTSIIARVSANGSTGDVSLTTPGGTTALNGFVFIPPPVITSFLPNTAASGAIITIAGNNLNGTTSLSLGGTPVSAFTVVSSTSIIASVSAGSTGAVSLTTPGGTTALNGFVFIPPPVITSFLPNTAASGAIITIAGNNLNGTSSLSLGGTPVSAFTVVSSTSIIARVSTGSTGDVSLTTPGGTTALNGFVFIPPPVITSFLPNTAASGAIITITGNNLNGTTSLSLGGTPVSAFTVVSSTSIIARVSANGSTGAVSLTTPGGTAARSGFTFIPPPVITSFLPNTAASGAIITIAGNNLNGTSSLSLGGTPVSSFTVVSSSSILAQVGAGSTGDVSLTTPGGTTALNGFVFIPPPVITSFAPNTTASGAIITITGNNLNGTTSLSLGGTPVSAFTIVSSSSVLAQVGAGSTGDVSLTTPGGTTALNGFVFIPPPIITSFAPNTAASGAIITITGNNLNGTTSLSLGGTPVSSFTIVSSSSVLAQVGAGSTGAVSLTTPGGTTSLNGFTFIPTPNIISFAPKSAAAGTYINITGTHLSEASAISLGGTPVASFTVVSSTFILAEVGTGSSGTLAVTTPGGIATMDGFLFIAPPTLIDFSPKAAGKGNIITITGANLNDITSIKLGGSFVASFRRITSSTVLATVGSGSSGSLELITSGGRATLSGFTFIPAPIINSLTPTSAATGTLMTVTGVHLTGTTEVSLGGVPVASFQVLSSTTLIVVVGSGASGSLYLTTPGGSGSLSGFKFLLYPPNTIPVFSNAFSPNGDGINDYWILDFLRDYPNATVQVLNRLGQIVFSGVGYNQPWDGRYKGELLPVGTYYYIINLKNGMPPIIGSITIIR